MFQQTKTFWWETLLNFWTSVSSWSLPSVICGYAWLSISTTTIRSLSGE